MAKLDAPPPHAVFLPLPTRGHTIPAMQFAHTLTAEHGFVVSFLCAEHLIIRFRLVLENNPRIRVILLPQHALLPAEHATDWDLGNRFIRLIRVMEDVVTVLEQTMERLVQDSKINASVPPPLCIISDCFVSGVQDVANKFSVPRYAFCPMSASSLATILYHSRLDVEQGVAPDHDAKLIPSLSSQLFRSADLPPDLQEERSPKEWRDYMFKTLPRLHESSGIVVNTFHALEGEILDAEAMSEAINPKHVPIYPVGPLLPSEFFSKELVDLEASSENYNEILEWLNKQAESSVLYISFGSIVTLNVRQIQEIAKALEACKQPFLWILRIPPSSEETTVLSKDFLTKTQGLILSSMAPQLLILSHPSVGGFMSHCGWNSTMECICRGIPMLTLPQFADQFINSRIVTEQLKVGVGVCRGANGFAESEGIERGIRQLMQGDEGEGMRRRAANLREEAARCVTFDGSSHSSRRSFVDEVATLQVS